MLLQLKNGKEILKLQRVDFSWTTLHIDGTTHMAKKIKIFRDLKKNPPKIL